jgi:hypothetical protein
MLRRKIGLKSTIKGMHIKVGTRLNHKPFYHMKKYFKYRRNHTKHRIMT